MTKPKSEGGGGYDEETARKVCGKMKAELEESFSWTGEFDVLRPYRKLIRFKAIHPIKTFHPHEWPHLRVYLEDELKKSAETLVGKPLFLDHWKPLKGSVLGAHYEDGALEGIADLEDEDVLQMIRDGQIKYGSVQFRWKTLENVNGVAPRGINYEHFSLLKDLEPGDPEATVEVWESIARELKEAKSPPADSETGPKLDKKGELKLSEQIVEPSLEDRVKGLEQSVENIYSRIAEVEGVLTAKIETLLALVPHVESTKEAEWDTEYINDLDDDCFAYIEPGGEKDEQGKTAPRSLRHFPYKNAQGNLSPDHVRNGLARLGQELGDWATADAKAQIKKKLCAAAKELEIESEVCGLGEQTSGEPPKAQQQTEESIEELKETVESLRAQIEALTEQKRALQEELEKAKKPSEAIISSTITPPSDILKEIKRLLPERVPMSWGGHYAQLWRNLRNIIKKHESQSQP